MGEKEARTGNSGFKKLAVQWLIEHSTSHQHLWCLDSFVLRNRQLLKPAKRYATWRIGVHAEAAATVSASKGSCYVSKYKKFFEDELTSTLQEGGG